MTHTELIHPQHSLVISKAQGRKEKEKPDSLKGGSASHSWPRIVLSENSTTQNVHSPIQFVSNTLPEMNCAPAAASEPFCSPVAAQDLEVLRMVSSCFLHLQQPHPPVRNTQDLHITSLFTL